ncbi:MAG: hypothetical protein ACJ77A_02020 [Actinomycetota bacterium]
MRNARIVLVVVAAVSLAAGQWANASGRSSSSGVSSVRPARGHFRPLALEGAIAARKQHDSQVPSLNDGDSPSEIQCKTDNTAGAANLRLDCDTILPNNEPHIAVDPTNPNHMVASSNDYDQCCDAFYTSFNAGKTWYSGDMSVEAPGQNKRTGSDPVTSFDRKHHTVIHASLNYLNNLCDGDVVASVSQDGGRKWNTVVQVASGGGCDNPFNDKEWITTDNNPSSPHYGTSYITWTAFFGSSRANDEGGVEPQDGVLPQAPIDEAHSTDGGFTWSDPQEISGTNPALCTFVVAERAGACNDNQFSVPTVAPDGTVSVAFINDQNLALSESREQFDDQYLVVHSGDGGATWSQPEFVVGLEDGSRDMPRNVNGRQTLTNQQMRVPFTEGFVADPTSNGRLYLTFADNRNGVHDSANPKTELDVFLMVKPSATAPWRGPLRVNSPDRGQIGNDQWFPAVDVNPTNGDVGVLYNDRRYTPTFRRHGATYAVSPPGGTAFVEHRASTALSHTRNSVFFRAHAVGCPACTRFHGDYISLAYGSDGKANLVWTDMREVYPPLGKYLQFIEYARR